MHGEGKGRSVEGNGWIVEGNERVVEGNEKECMMRGREEV